VLQVHDGAPARGVLEPRVRRLSAGRAARPCLSAGTLPRSNCPLSASSVTPSMLQLMRQAQVANSVATSSFAWRADSACLAASFNRSSNTEIRPFKPAIVRRASASPGHLAFSPRRFPPIWKNGDCGSSKICPPTNTARTRDMIEFIRFGAVAGRAHRRGGYALPPRSRAEGIDPQGS